MAPNSSSTAAPFGPSEVIAPPSVPRSDLHPGNVLIDRENPTRHGSSTSIRARSSGGVARRSVRPAQSSGDTWAKRGKPFPLSRGEPKPPRSALPERSDAAVQLADDSITVLAISSRAPTGAALVYHATQGVVAVHALP